LSLALRFATVVPTIRLAFRSLLVLFLAIPACRGPLPVDFFEESPLGSGTWTKLAVEPAWVKAPPQNAGHVVLRIESQSNLRSIAMTNLGRSAQRGAADRVRSALLPVVTSPEAEAAAVAAQTSLRLVRCACRDEVLTRDLVPGNTLATVWGLYEIPIDTVLASVDESRRSAARAALEKP